MPQPQTILVVDDDADIRTIVGRLFTAHGYRVNEAADGITAFQLARQIAPDLIILDLGLPGHDGWTVAHELRAEPTLDQVPILVITANGSSAAHRLARSAGCRRLLTNRSPWLPSRRRSAHCWRATEYHRLPATRAKGPHQIASGLRPARQP